MPNAWDIVYSLGLALTAPFWLVRRSARTKVLRALRERCGAVAPRPGDRPGVWIHAVSLGEINATQALVKKLAVARPELRFIVSTTTDTGFDRGRKLYGDDPSVTLVRYPLDFSRSIRRALDALRPSVVVLLELEVWPNFVRQCARRNIPVVLVNGRITEPSYRKYRLARCVLGRTFARLAAVAAQDETYARRFIDLGAPADRVCVTGTMKFDTATIADRIDGTEQLAADLGLTSGERLWVCGSTGPGEEPIILSAYRQLLQRHPTLRLAIIPRHPERFDEVADEMSRTGLAIRRRSNPQSAIRNSQYPPVLLGDTMGELRKFYSLADVVFVGRSLVDLGPRQHGSDMIEPAALAKPTIVGPFTSNFTEAVALLSSDDALVVVASEAELIAATDRLLSSPADALAMGRRAQQTVRANQGATDRNIQTVLGHLPG